MGDVRFEPIYARLREAGEERGEMLARLTDDETIQALAAASRAADPLLANVLATEALNRMRRMRASLAALAEGVLTVGVDGRLRWANPAAERLLMLPRDSIVGAMLHEVVCAEGRTRICDAVSSRREEAGEVDVSSPAGARFPASYTTAPIRAEGGQDAGAVVTIQDITSRRARERALREAEQRYHSLFANHPDAVVMISPEGKIMESNAAAETLTGIPPASARDRPFAEFLAPEDVPLVSTLFSRVLAGETIQMPLRLRTATGTLIPTEVLGIPIAVNGDVVGVHGIARRIPGPEGQEGLGGVGPLA